MRRIRAIGLAAATVTAVLGMPVPAAVAASGDLYVDNTGTCSDSNPGTRAAPFCTVGAAAAVVEPGTTVHLNGWFKEDLRITRSGEKDAPVVFTGPGTVTGVNPNDSTPAVTVDGAHDVVFREAPLFSALVKNSDRVTFDRTTSASDSTPLPLVAITGGSDNRVTRNWLDQGGSTGVSVSGGATGTVVSGNVVATDRRGIVVDGATGTVVTNNTVLDGCGPGIGLSGGSTGFRLYNNIVAWHTSTHPNPRDTCGEGTSATEVLASADSLPGSKADYNLVWPATGGLAYNWGGTAAKSVAELLAVSNGEGTHDLMADPMIIAGMPGEGSPAIDSAAMDAPGVLDTDLVGNPPVDDPLVANSGSGSGVLDRGAYELQDALDSVTLSTDNSWAPYGTAVTFTAKAQSRWPATLIYTFDFGDGTSVKQTGLSTATHTYGAACACKATVTVTDQSGRQVKTAQVEVKATTPGELTPKITVNPALPSSNDPISHTPPLTVRADAAATAAPWPTTSYAFDFGDGSPVVTSGYQAESHTYAKPGDYKVTVTVKDSKGSSASTSTTAHVEYAKATYTPVKPFRMLDTRKTWQSLSGGNSLTLDVSNGYPSGDKPVTSGSPEAVVLNVTATNATADTYLTLFPGGQDRPTASNLNVKAGQTVANLVTVPVGKDGTVRVYNHAGRSDVVVDFVGYYQPNAGQGFSSTKASRLVDTTLTGNTTKTLKVAGTAGVPEDATAVVLNLTADRPTANGYLTAFPHGMNRPTVSNLNFRTGQTVANQAVVPLGADGSIDLYNFTGSTRVIADVFGYYSPDSGALFTPIVPRRIRDTRSGSPVGPDGTFGVDITGFGAPFYSSAVLLNVTAVQPTASGYLTVWGGSSTRPATSNLNFAPGQTVANHVTVPFSPIATDGRLRVYNFTGDTHVVLDLTGWFSLP
ncbi:PKD domain-containing protein [Kitasatospora sp. NPDC051914]|uniref:PKD domain-containing protein n=1 Tax=Kitasatospora sp. NPDC051914 TaxID=3154945 RepID=UPI00342B0908